jgi:sugar lactone lactonase YvrE
LIKEWTAANHNVAALASAPSAGVAVDGGGNVYYVDRHVANSEIREWQAASGAVTTLVPSGLGAPAVYGLAVDGADNVYLADSFNHAIKELPHAFVDPTAKIEAMSAGTDALPVVLPATANLTGPFAPVSDSAWLTITGITNGVLSFAFTADASLTNRTAHITWLGQSIPVTQMPAYAVGATNLLEAPAAGRDSVVLSVRPMKDFPWVATANASWLHLSRANESGVGSTLVVFQFDGNRGPTRTGTITIAGQRLTVVQAGGTYVAANPLITLASSGLSHPSGVAVDDAGNVYVADAGDNAIKEWTPAGDALITLVSSGLKNPLGVAVDGAGNLYIADTGDNAVKKWTAAGNTLTTLVSSGLKNPVGVAVDDVGNVYIADAGNNAIKQWTAASNTVTSLVSSGLKNPMGVAVDGAGNLYIADVGHNAIKQWTAASHALTTLVAPDMATPNGVAVDGSGNVYFADGFNSAIDKWTAPSRTVTVEASLGLRDPTAVSVDASGNAYIVNLGNHALVEMPHAFVDPTAKTETALQGSDVLPMVLPATENLTGPFAPISHSAWLTLTGNSSGVVSFAFTTTTAKRTGSINLLGKTIMIIQTTKLPPVLKGLTVVGKSAFQLGFTENPGTPVTVLTTTNLSQPLANWKVLGTFTNDALGQYHFSDPSATNGGQHFYRVSSP